MPSGSSSAHPQDDPTDPTALDRIYSARFSEDDAAGKDRIWAEICVFLQRFVDESQPVLDVAADRGYFIRHIRAPERWATVPSEHPAVAPSDPLVSPHATGALAARQAVALRRRATRVGGRSAADFLRASRPGSGARGGGEGAGGRRGGGGGGGGGRREKAGGGGGGEGGGEKRVERGGGERRGEREGRRGGGGGGGRREGGGGGKRGERGGERKRGKGGKRERVEGGGGGREGERGSRGGSVQGGGEGWCSRSGVGGD